MQYRPEIDGLRSVAVLAVLIYHAEFALGDNRLLAGGFLGVDVFFVISGYLIANIVYREVQSQTFSILNFYERRARRLLPALFVVLFSSIAVAWFVLDPKAMYEFSGSGLAALSFASNIWFYLEDSYTAEISQLKPLLHTWSLAVEEQFYLVFPLLLMATHQWRKRNLVVLLVILFSISLLMTLYLASRDLEFSFFMPFTRTWELLVGVIIAICWQPSNRSIGKLGDFLSLLGLTAIVICCFKVSHDSPDMAWWLLVCVIGSGLFIMFAGGNGIASQLLSSKPFVIVGLISYSVYLWHFPIFAFARSLDLFGTELSKLLSIGLTFILSVVFYLLVEKPFRFKNTISRKPFFMVLIIATVALLITFSYLRFSNGASHRVSSQITSVVDFNYWQKADKKGIFWQHESCLATVYFTLSYDVDKPFEKCRSSVALDKSKPTILIIGDSHAESVSAGVMTHFSVQANVIQRLAPACNLLPRMVSPNDGTTCFNTAKKIYQEIPKIDPDVVIYASRWRPHMYEFLEHQLTILKSLNSAEIILVGPMLYWDLELPKLIAQTIEQQPLVDYQWLKPNSTGFDIDSKMREIAKRADIKFLSPHNTFCNQNRVCKTKVAKSPTAMTSWDHEHLTKLSSDYLIAKNYELIRSALKEQ